MTEKRFYISCDSNQNIYDDVLRCYYSSIDAKKLCELLNELNDECEFLEIENEALEDGATKYAERYHQALKENEELKKENEYLHKYNIKLQNQPLLFGVQTIPDTMEILEVNTRLEEENEQLKKQLQKIHKLIDENIRIYEDTTTNDDFLQIQLDIKLETLYNLRKELFK